MADRIKILPYCYFSVVGRCSNHLPTVFSSSAWLKTPCRLNFDAICHTSGQAKLLRQWGQHSFGCSLWRPVANAYLFISRSRGVSILPYCTNVQSFNFRSVVLPAWNITMTKKALLSRLITQPPTHPVNSVWHRCAEEKVFLVWVAIAISVVGRRRNHLAYCLWVRDGLFSQVFVGKKAFVVWRFQLNVWRFYRKHSRWA